MTTREAVSSLLEKNALSIKEIQAELAKISISASETRIKQLVFSLAKTQNIFERKEKRLGRLRCVYYTGPHTEHDASCAELNRKIA